jgi:hypothetical protein
MKRVFGRTMDSSGQPMGFSQVYVSDSKGTQAMPPRGVTTDEDGTFYLEVNDGEYITAKYIGKIPKTVSTANTATQNFMFRGKSYPNSLVVEDIELDQDTSKTELPAVVIKGERPKPKKTKKEKDNTLLYVGIGLLAIAVVGTTSYFAFKD